MEFLLQIINGLQIGSIYALVSLGYTMVYGIAQLINFAHGDIIMVGAYVSLFCIPTFTKMGLPVWLTVIPSIVVCVVLGMLTERVAYRPLRNSPRISNLITAIGVSLLLENVFMKLFTPNTRAFPKVFTQAPIEIGELHLNFGTVITIAVTLILSFGLQYFMKKTKYGKAMLATSEDYGAAMLVGINVNNTIQLTFAIGSGLAAIASVLYVSAYPQVEPLMGAMLGIKAFIAAVLGGIGLLPGAVIGGFILGIVESLTRAYLSSQLADAFVFAILIIVLLVKPTGILGKNIREKV
ncbi:High-affinity branched-chain amino acid transport system permease protein LivH [Fusobacterium sp. DD29]|uniref:branched-chain amino acid ABC transporter permease n=1 Tax=unclassified Fusobacterium TaxID=2648384 RepID=UPI001B8B186C|nr:MULTISPECIES: branched-chain amino acid ABC transporter permease [unclassified Fusobacterium]MBR8701225.1 High-affinity branched-chain amino acid transport system permease protein LivH [Fusobacterium sp. DD45]MBR8710993.1 High-affinity branched-chain amino acid transport system permease protein LivH [Fusobacterium sp. DD28]MBR8748880.1 High-affinity branched-chain amino acid transport system permease protein LivH [Fusobacterium sp. DD29]MBR8751576.1 High-affinity branched-chain amino acid tr